MIGLDGLEDRSINGPRGVLLRNVKIGPYGSLRIPKKFKKAF